MTPRATPGPQPAAPGDPSLALLPADDCDDRTLMIRVAAGDEFALEALYGRYGRASYGLARRILVDEQLAQDVVQEVFLTVWRDAARFDTARGAFSSWLLTMTHHKAVDCVRREENLRKRRTTADLLEDKPVDGPGVHDEVWSTVRGEQVRAAMQTLPAVQREVLTLAYFGGYTQREIAGLTKTPLGTVKTRMLAGMARLKSGLEGLQNSAPDHPFDQPRNSS